MHDDVLLDDVEQVSSVSREELEVPRIQDAHVTHSSSDAHDDENLLNVHLVPSASAREVTPSINIL